MNINFYKSFFVLAQCVKNKKVFNQCVIRCSWPLGITLLGIHSMTLPVIAQSSSIITEPVSACVISRDTPLTPIIRSQLSQCLHWQAQPNIPVCHGRYDAVDVTPLPNADEIRILADEASLYNAQKSTLHGHVAVQQADKVIDANTAYIYRDSKTNQITKIEFVGEVHYQEPGRMMIARQMEMNPQDKSGSIYDVLYRFNTDRAGAVLPAWGQASFIKRFANKDYLLHKATYTTCAPQDKAWDIEASSLALDNASATGVAKNAVIRLRRWPVFYTPYLSFPTNKERKSGFLLPMVGYSNVGGFDLGVPYYWNMAPNYDMTIAPHLFSERGVMLGSEFRFLTSNSYGVLSGSFLPDDKAYKQFLQGNELAYPTLRGNSTNRWSIGITEETHLTPNLTFHALGEQVSDNYYLQDFSSNLAQITQRQLLRQADLTYTTEHWLLRSMVQSYQTLQPVNEPPVDGIYERLPQIMAHGTYYNLPFNANLNVNGQYDQFHLPSTFNYWNTTARQQGPRFYLNPVASVPFTKPWGYVTPSAELVETYYQVDNPYLIPNTNYNVTLPRYSINSGLFFERDTAGNQYTQTLEPRLFYLNVPYQNQTQHPIYDSAYMIFNMDQLFRTNRFSGFDRIGDANQLAYALTSRWLTNDSGVEKAMMSVGQIRYFENRKVPLCQSFSGYCEPNLDTMGFLSPTYDWSPIASRALYRINSQWGVNGDYIWDPATNATNNADLNLHYNPFPRAIFSVGYSYLINADITTVRNNAGQNNALNQGIFATSLPLTEKWTGIGAYSQNISKNYSMMSLLGVQYDSCCWAMRLLGGRTFKSLNAQFEPQYNNNVYFQILLKGLGSVATSDPYNLLSTYIPGYTDPFHR